MAVEDSDGVEFGEVLQAWRGELAAFAREHAFWLSEPEITVVEFAADGVSISRPGVEKSRLEDAQGLSLAVSRSGPSRDVAVQIPRREVLRATVWLPKANARTLRQALHFELERLSPVEPGQLYFDFAVMGRDKATGRVELALRIVRRQVVDEALALCHGAGLNVAQVLFEGDAQPADSHQFPVDRPAWYRLQWRKWNLAFLAGLALALALAALLAWYGRNAAAADLLSDQVATEETRAFAVSHIAQEITRTNDRVAFFAKQKQAPMTVAVLAELARILPDGTWLNEVEVAGARVHIRGYSHGAADLIGAIDHSGNFVNAQFGAPLVRNPAGNVEQFDLVFDIKTVKK